MQPLRRAFSWSLSGRLTQANFVLASLTGLVAAGLLSLVPQYAWEAGTTLGDWLARPLTADLGDLTLELSGDAANLVLTLGTFAAWLLIVLILTLWFWTVCVRRLHDVNRSGWWTLLVVVPPAAAVGIVALCLWPGTRGPNAFGLDSLHPELLPPDPTLPAAERIALLKELAQLRSSGVLSAAEFDREKQRLFGTDSATN